MKKFPSAAQFAVRHANAVRIAAKVSGLIAAGYRVFDELGDRVLDAGKRADGDVVFTLEDSGNVAMFINDPTLDNGALDGVKQFNKFFEGWSFIHPKDVKALKV
ncbi:hypothetical protein [Rhizobium leguminosarum]|uniref:hypothetical protein n=1 Tax=Rhizobium leguminosarum TaxID=384 RepID=UPI002E0D548E|nr:hypothetical protein U8Q02_42425 [Rhizobium leguminosarum]